MILRLLNGDLLETECKTADEAKMLLSHHLTVPTDRIHITKNEHDNQHLVFIVPTPQIVITSENIVRDFPVDQLAHYPFDTTWLAECVNQSILDLFRPHLRSFHYLFANPGMADEIMGYLSSIDPDHPPREPHSPHIWRFKCLSLNPHDRVVDYLFVHPHLIYNSQFKLNSNRRAVKYILDHFSNHPVRLVEWAGFFKHPYPESVEYVWNGIRAQAFLQPGNFDLRNPCELAFLPANDCDKANELRNRDFTFGNGCCQSSNPELLRKCIEYVTKNGGDPPRELLANPSPVTVEWLLLHPNILETKARICQTNPHNDIVAYYLDECPSLIDVSALARNHNTRAIQRVQEKIDAVNILDPVHTSHIQYILTHPHSTNIKLGLSFVLKRLSTVKDLEVILRV